MGIELLRIKNIRNLSNLELVPHRSFNLICGANGSGKTSLLEAINLLGVGRSFRSNQPAQYITHLKESCEVFGEAGAADLPSMRLGISKSRSGDSVVRINGENVRGAAELANYLPLQIITPSSIDLIEGGAKGRRNFLDWGVFHVEPQFITWWRDSQKLLRQRGAALKQIPYGASAEAENVLSVWDREIAKTTDRIQVARLGYLKLFKSLFNAHYSDIVPGADIEFQFRRGWPEGLDLIDAFRNSRERDVKLGYTQYGPHKADIKIKVDGRAADDVLSRGQKKILVCALKCLQAKILQQEKAKTCVFLVDDLAAELDLENQKRLCGILQELSSQVFITAVSPELLLPALEGKAYKMFHVERGALSAS
ncbi:MAG: DNA replication/repair protein RecF [Gammaproteobacteria bacterium]|nr:MAG: DNA replication/repair protein RecF [Gammaproteobacteria bacterium]